eukprot:1913010-Amphidinium_carterae.1
MSMPERNQQKWNVSKCDHPRLHVTNLAPTVAMPSASRSKSFVWPLYHPTPIQYKINSPNTQTNKKYKNELPKIQKWPRKAANR